MIMSKSPIYMLMFVGGAMGHFIGQVILSIKNERLQHFNTNDKGCCHRLAYDKNSNFCYLEIGSDHCESIKSSRIRLMYDTGIGVNSKKITRTQFRRNFVIPKKSKTDIFYITKRIMPWYFTLNHFHFTENDYYDSFENTISQFLNLKFLVIRSYDSDMELLSLLKHQKTMFKLPYNEAKRQVERDNEAQVNMLRYLDVKSIAYTTMKFRDIITYPLLCYNIICDYLGENSKLQQEGSTTITHA